MGIGTLEHELEDDDVDVFDDLLVRLIYVRTAGTMSGGALLGFVSTVVGGVIWLVGWWVENDWPTSYRYRHSRVRIWLDNRRNDGLPSVRRIPLGSSHVTLCVRSKIPLPVRDFSVRFVTSASDEDGDRNAVSPDCIRVTSAQLIDDVHHKSWPATRDDNKGGRYGFLNDRLPAHASRLLYVEIEAGKEWWGQSLFLSLRLHVEGAGQPFFARIPAGTLSPRESGDVLSALRPRSGEPAPV